jgi:hypothetical protein
MILRVQKVTIAKNNWVLSLAIVVVYILIFILLFAQPRAKYNTKLVLNEHIETITWTVDKHRSNDQNPLLE